MHKLGKIIKTIINLKETAYHHYGKKPFSVLKFIYYSGIRINTFIIYEIDLTKEFIEYTLDPEYKVITPSIEELNILRNDKNLPREFYYDILHGAKKCYIAIKDGSIAYIHWVLFKGDYSRFLVLENGCAELNYNTTIQEFRGKSLTAKMMSFIAKDLQNMGYSKLFGVVHDQNYPQNICMTRAGFKEIKRINAIGPFNRKLKV